MEVAYIMIFLAAVGLVISLLPVKEEESRMGRAGCYARQPAHRRVDEP